jgi:two-component system cell cycle sensor histidine kinase PleC
MTSGNYLLDVINDILDMSKIEAGRMKLDYEPLDLAQTLTESLRVVSGRAENKNLVVTADIRGAIPIVADRRAMKQIAVNLLSNAVKFTPDGGKIIVRGRVLNGSVMLTIVDSGIGIAPQSLAKLGRPFEQVESQLTKSYHGSGLGLAIAKSLANLHGGSMKLRSKLGTGTIVCVTLPCGHSEHTTAPSLLIAETPLPAAAGKPRARRSVSPGHAPQATRSRARRQPASAPAADPPQLFPA